MLTILSKKLIKNKFKNYNLKYILNYNFYLTHNLHIGGNVKNYNILLSSYIYAKRNYILFLKLNLFNFQLNKLFKILELISFKRGTIYFVNNYIGFKLKMLTFYKIDNFFFLKKKKKIIKSLYLISNWYRGFLTNKKAYLEYIKKYKISLKLPYFGLLGNHTFNEIPSKEFLKMTIPYSTCLDTVTNNLNLIYYGISVNGSSLDSTYFFLFSLVNTFLIGTLNEKLQFTKELNVYTFLIIYIV